MAYHVTYGQPGYLPDTVDGPFDTKRQATQFARNVLEVDLDLDLEVEEDFPGSWTIKDPQASNYHLGWRMEVIQALEQAAA